MDRTEQTELSDSQLRILDFYFVFPSLIAKINFPQELRGWRSRLKRPHNPYHVSCNAHLIFQQVRPVQESAIRLLSAQGMAKIVDSGVVSLSILPDRIPRVVADLIGDRNKDESEAPLVEFLAVHLAKLPLTGPRGLKARTGLMEARYDAV